MRSIYMFLWLASASLLTQTGFAQPDVVLNSITSVASPVDITGAGDGSGRLFIVEKAGRIRVYNQLTNTLLTPNYLNIATKVNPGGERGLLGLAFHPNYETNGFFYVNYVAVGSNTTKISRFTADPPSSNTVDAATEVELMSVPHPFDNHKAGDLSFGPDNYLYIGMGDGGSGGDPGDRAQNPQEFLGKMLRIDVDNPSGGKKYGIPPDNPYIGIQTPTDYLDEIWALGVRNPWRFSFDRSTGDMWIADVGQGTKEEVSFQPAGSAGGANYGWRCYEGTFLHNPSGCLPQSSYAGPIFEYGHNNATGGFSITGGFVYRGTDVPSLTGWYVMADYISHNFWLIKHNGSTWVSDLQPDVPVVNISTFGEDDDGEMYAASLGGTIYKVSASPLPITLLDFKGAYRQGRVELNWTTATEKNAAYFQVERKTQGADFEVIGSVQAAGESAFQQNYFFEDLFASSGENMYRLKMVDFDNTFEYSPAVSVFVKETEDWQLNPNPAAGQVTLLINGDREIPWMKFAVYNAQGQVVISHEETHPEFPLNKAFNIAHLPGGVYFCRLDADGKSDFKRLVVR